MRVTEKTKRFLAFRRQKRDMIKDGWEYVGEGGGSLWELERGHRWMHKIVDVKICASGKGLWVKIEGPGDTLHDT